MRTQKPIRSYVSKLGNYFLCVYLQNGQRQGTVKRVLDIKDIYPREYIECYEFTKCPGIEEYKKYVRNTPPGAIGWGGAAIGWYRI